MFVLILHMLFVYLNVIIYIDKYDGQKGPWNKKKLNYKRIANCGRRTNIFQFS